MAKSQGTHKIQVTLEPEQYERVAEIAMRDGKKLAAVVRESVVRYCLEPEQKRQRLEALRELEALDLPTGDYADWKRQYAERKADGAAAGTADNDTP